MLHIKKYDIVFLQETHSTKHDAKNWRAQWGGPVFYSHGTNASKGVAILFRKNFNVNIITSEHDQEGRRVIVRFNYEDFQLLACNVYGPNTDQPDFFIETFHDIAKLSKDNVILGGDFNLVLDLDIDKRGGRNTTHLKARQVIKDFMEDLSLTDVWRCKTIQLKEYTWQRDNIKVRLDFFLISSNLVQLVNQAQILDSYSLSDHNFPFISIEFTHNPKGRGYWKFNTSLLRDKEYVAIINQLIDE